MSVKIIMEKCPVIILCGGMGRRLGKLGKLIPKTLVDFNGKPILEQKLIRIVNQGFKTFIIAIGYKGQMIIKMCKSLKLNCRIDFSSSSQNASMLYRICKIKRFFPDRAIITYGDSISNLSLNKLLSEHLKRNSLVTIVTAPIRSPFGLISGNNKNLVVSFDEKPILNYYIGYFVMEKKAFEYIPKRIIKLNDAEGLLIFFKILISIKKLSFFEHKSHNITFNTIEELDYARKSYLKFFTC